MKKIFFLILIAFFVFSFFIIEQKQKVILNNDPINEEKRAIFLSYLEFNNYLKDKEEKISKENIINILDNIKNNGFNMLIVHVRPFSDTIYHSNIYPTSDTVKVNGKEPNYDVLDFIIKESQKRNIEVHAWINPYRISNETDLSKLSNGKTISELIKNKDAKIIENKGIFYNPASTVVKQLIISGIDELVTNYKIDGIHFDDYFYPDYDIDLINYQNYIESGGTLSIEDYRYNIILDLIGDTYKTIKTINSNVKFGISPEGNIENDYKKHFLNVSKILSEEGYVDYIMPQIYFGFLNESKPFIETLNEWNDLIKINNIKLIPALAFYKVGQYDKYAKSGENEWIEYNNIINRQVLESRKVNNYGGFALFRYDFVFNKEKANMNTENELNELISILN